MEKNKTNNKWGWQGGDNDEWYTPAEAIQPIMAKWNFAEQMTIFDLMGGTT